MKLIWSATIQYPVRNSNWNINKWARYSFYSDQHFNTSLPVVIENTDPQVVSLIDFCSFNWFLLNWHSCTFQIVDTILFCILVSCSYNYKLLKKKIFRYVGSINHHFEFGFFSGKSENERMLNAPHHLNKFVLQSITKEFGHLYFFGHLVFGQSRCNLELLMIELCLFTKCATCCRVW